MNKGFINVFSIMGLGVILSSCCAPSAYAPNGSFPQSITETHTKTTMVMPPSYATVSMPPPSITQTAPVIQQPMMYQAPAPIQSNPCEPYRLNNPCISPSQLGAFDPCAYQVSVPQQQAPKYTIAIPPAPAPQYTIALPQGNPPNYAVVQQQAPVTANVPIKLNAHQEGCENGMD